MAKPRYVYMDGFFKLLAAACGIDLDGGSDVMPYNPEVLKAAAQSGKAMG